MERTIWTVEDELQNDSDITLVMKNEYCMTKDVLCFGDYLCGRKTDGCMRIGDV